MVDFLWNVCLTLTVKPSQNESFLDWPLFSSIKTHTLHVTFLVMATELNCWTSSQKVQTLFLTKVQTSLVSIILCLTVLLLVALLHLFQKETSCFVDLFIMTNRSNMEPCAYKNKFDKACAFKNKFKMFNANDAYCLKQTYRTCYSYCKSTWKLGFEYIWPRFL